jgi:DNA-directed RNA polymerase subunit RPC12/RpoP
MRCRCDGANEFCAFCFGRGVVGPTNKKNSSDCRRSAGPTGSPNSKRPEKPVVSCPVCGRRLAFKDVGAHMRTAHPASSVRGQMTAPASTPGGGRPLTTPNREEYVFKHLPARWDKYGPKYTLTCRRCGREMNQALLPGHLHDIHGVQDPFEVVRISARVRNPPRLSRSERRGMVSRTKNSAVPS